MDTNTMCNLCNIPVSEEFIDDLSTKPKIEPLTQLPQETKATTIKSFFNTIFGKEAEDKPLNFEDLACMLADNPQGMLIIDLLSKGFVEVQLNTWRFEGRIFESRPGVLRLL